MIKLKRYALLLAGLMLLSFAGCGTAQTPSTAKDNPSFADTPADVPSATEISDDIIAEESAPPVAEPEQPAITEPVPSQTAEEKTQETAPKENAVTAPPAQSEQPRETQPPRQTETPKPEEPKPTPPPVVAEMPYVRPSADEVEKAVAKYINEYRLVQGDTAVIVLPGLTEVARFRASQLITNFSHDEDIDACTVLKYGELVDMTQYGLPESANYYQGFNREAIAKGNWTGTADEIGQKIAAGLKNSKDHWSYVGSSEYGYMAVGITFNPSDSHWYCCICMSSQNYGG